MKHTINNLYKKIVLRHIEWSRPEIALETLMQFVDETKDCKYDAPIGKLLRKQKSSSNLDTPKVNKRFGSIFGGGSSTPEQASRNSMPVGGEDANTASKVKKRFSSIFGGSSAAATPTPEEIVHQSEPVDGIKNKPRLVEQGRAFFSSEIVIKALKCVGLIETDDASSNWLPTDLAESKDKVQLIEAAKLNPEQLLIITTTE